MIKEFQKEYRWLSNFWPAIIHLDGVQYQSIEHAYQAAKFESAAVREYIKGLSAGEAKKKGKGVQHTNDKVQLMELLVKEKFSVANLILKEKLLATRNEVLQEGNYWGDTFWGVDLKTGKGQNILGKIIMAVRNDLQFGVSK